MAGENTGLFIPTTQGWDVTGIYSTDVDSSEFKEIIVRLYKNMNVVATAVNLKDTGYYVTSEFVTGQRYFPDPLLTSGTATQPVYRMVYRKVIDFGTLPNTATKSVAHEITFNETVKFTAMYATTTDPVGLKALTIPYASAIAGNIIEMVVDSTNVTITTGSDRTAYTNTFVVLEYLKF